MLRAVNLLGLQILRIDREGMIDDVITHGTWRYLCEKYLLTPIVTNLRQRWHKTREKMLSAFVTFDLVGFTSHQYIIILQWYSGFYDETFVVNIKKAQTTKTVELLLSECRIFWRNGKLKLRRLSGRFQTVISRPGDKVQTLESPGLSGTVDSTACYKAS